ncbi:hypothetical protein F7725_003323 [Dissostichus mawsoni]|uniref:C-factor n=1 Tax=Dissostichus mawsoni TaxID=36200 RepID=A0A7J5YA00_DISMA|nr:hypothetical protein F7725_003323 [Dissostichus mawsoni]
MFISGKALHPSEANTNPNYQSSSPTFSRRGCSGCGQTNTFVGICMQALRGRIVQAESQAMAAPPVSVLITGANRGLGLEMSHTTNKASDSMPPDDEPAVFVNAVMTKEDGSRKYNKKHYCYYCELQVQKISRHLVRRFCGAIFNPVNSNPKVIDLKADQESKHYVLLLNQLEMDLRIWTSEEIAAVERHLRRCIIMNQVPGKEACEDCISAEPQALSNRDLRAHKTVRPACGLSGGTGGLNLLINNAGILFRKTLQETSPEEMQETFNTNEFLPHLRSAAKACGTPGMSTSKAAVVNISSTLASMQRIQQTYEFIPAVSYRISKAALNMLTMCAVEELRKDEILFSLLHPGWVRTEMGGENGEIDAQESVLGMCDVMASLTEKQNGAFLDYKGNPIPW